MRRRFSLVSFPAPFCKSIAKPLHQSEDGVDLAMIETFLTPLTIIHKFLSKVKVNSILALMQRLGYLSRWRREL
jgi:hypothetical protein